MILEADSEAVLTDRLLDERLHDVRAPRSREARIPHFDPGMRIAVDVLQRTLVRFHPSFRFEERLAARLHAEGWSAGPVRLPGRVIPLRRAGVDVRANTQTDHPERRTRGYLLGGAAIASASIAGAVLAWRHVRAGGAPATVLRIERPA